MLDLAIINEGWPKTEDWETRLTRAAEAAIRHTPHAGLIIIPASIEIAIRLDSDDAVQTRNRD
jgi:hypothetical protein